MVWLVGTPIVQYTEQSSFTALPPITTLSDLKTTVEGMCALADKAIQLGQGVIPRRINQDVLESWLGHQWQAG